MRTEHDDGLTLNQEIEGLNPSSPPKERGPSHADGSQPTGASSMDIHVRSGGKARRLGPNGWGCWCQRAHRERDGRQRSRLMGSLPCDLPSRTTRPKSGPHGPACGEMGRTRMGSSARRGWRMGEGAVEPLLDVGPIRSKEKPGVRRLPVSSVSRASGERCCRRGSCRAGRR